MKRSSDRILTTHVGSLARPADLLETMRDKEQGRAYDREAFAARVRTAVADVVRRQAAVGLDVVSDGEQGKPSFVSYVAERLSGFEALAGQSSMAPSWRRELEMFPDYYREYFKKYAAAVAPMPVLVCRGPVRYTGQAAVAADIENLKAALADVEVEEAFLPATSPRGFGGNEHYATDEEYECAVADALREEYQAIVDAGLVLQVDDPHLTEILSEDPATTRAQRRAAAERHVEVVNHALRGIPPDRVRFHTCYGLNHGPRLHDVPLADVVDLMLAVDAGAYSFEVANPRHQHEWRVWETTRLPEGRILIPGFLSHATNFVEHPELIADGIVTYARLVGRENVLAGADCGFSSRATFAPEVDPAVVWAKFQALGEGARLASRRLW
ncbi:MAG TPA: cobalamin-independent methionine synthase II family protein [Candidatus Dormibacteraeota bacterium]|nr:cobalamin-independent methionine synthase II family protein [Candidatus Dormibacteraeota bacterium]